MTLRAASRAFAIVCGLLITALAFGLRAHAAGPIYQAVNVCDAATGSQCATVNSSGSLLMNVQTPFVVTGTAQPQFQVDYNATHVLGIGVNSSGQANLTPTAGVSVTSTTTPQFTVAYDGTHSLTTSVNSAGNATLTPTGTLTLAGATTISTGGFTVATGGITSTGPFNNTGIGIFQSSGVTILLQRLINSSAASSSNQAQQSFELHNSAPANIAYGQINVNSDAVTAGLESGSFHFQTFNVGTQADRLVIASTGATAIISAANMALAVGPNGATTPAFSVDGSVSSAVTGVKITGQATGNAPTIATANAATGIKLDAGTSGVVSIGTVSTGGVQLGHIGAFVASDKYLVMDASGNIHVSAIGPAS